ncbi:DUF2264 domain-containing protein [Streptomyces cavernae]|uniref:DUF2264 domain-containing protein n=1 Tax=Streptomyces cavernae TaxID=2259034 RepID=UPI000FEB89B7|nr:DUF2264 domain-containing protein [Streptomyces cavernae]
MPTPHLDLPATDRVLSPRTGWTRAHWEVLADRLLDALEPYATPGLAQYRLPGRGSLAGVATDGLEGYAHSFLLAAFRIAGAGGDVDPRLVERYARGLAAGTDRDSGEAWPQLTDRSPQMEHAASIALALHETRPWIWNALDGEVRERVVDWLWGFVGRRAHDDGTRLCQVVAEQFLASVGGPHRQEDIDGGLDRIEDWYAGDGWYRDGDTRAFDHTNAWAFHLYPLLWSRMAGAAAAGARSARYRERLARFLGSYARFFGSDGAPVHFGHGLTYRMAVVAPVWLGALMDCTPLAPGLTRRLASGTARHFVERGVPDERGLLPLGWYGTFLPTIRPEMGPAAPYTAGKAFLGLLLPAEHPVWTERELPLPVEESDQYMALPAPGWLLHGTRDDGIVRLVNHGSERGSGGTGGGQGDPAEATAGAMPFLDDPHYAKFGYSTATAPDAAGHGRAPGIDGHLALLSWDGTASRRTGIRPLACSGRTATSRHDAQLMETGEELPVLTTSVLHGPWEIRVHRVCVPAGVGLREGGYAVADDRPVAAGQGPGWALVRTGDGLTSVVVGLHGWDEETGMAHETDASAFGAHSATPYLRCAAGHPAGVYVSLVALTRDAVNPRALRESVVCSTVGDDVHIAFPDGESVTVRADRGTDGDGGNGGFVRWTHRNRPAAGAP